jgi:flavodoxin
MSKALVVYASRTGQTKAIADLIAEGIRFAGHEAKVKPVSEIKTPEDLAGYDAYVLGSATYHGEMISSMKQLLFLAEKAGLGGKVGGSFGSYGWSGEAPERIFNTMKHVLALDMTGDCLRLKTVNLEGGPAMAQGYGKEIGEKMP